ncbi:MAG: 4-hydroxy-3-methylbut-2-enyl diphosphate reductase [candidate division Zixibacteria bacterium]|nr:4-hydroxy-3-methylbut-2-enyl diphosphate reductase [candidate division Zixibacteria bacterium]
MKIYLAKYRGFCPGVRRAIRIAKQTRENKLGPVTILREVVHNAAVVNELEKAGLPKADNIESVKSGTLIISAHGIAQSEITRAESLGLSVVDATCPLVKHIHRTAREYVDKGYAVLLFGDPGHDEVKGIVGVAPDKIWVVDKIDDIAALPQFNQPVALISQSTRSLESFESAAIELQKRFENIAVTNTICRPTIDRQKSIKELAAKAQLIIVVGSKNSANSRRLTEIGGSMGAKSFLVDNASEIVPFWFANVEMVGVTAGASTPEYLVDEVINKITEIAANRGQQVEISEEF